MKNIFTLIFFLIGLTAVMAQPSYRISLEFKFYENKKLVDLTTIKKNYQLLDESNQNIISSGTDGIRETAKTGNLTFSGGVVYNDLVRKFVSRNDTMTLFIKNNLKRDQFQFTIDTLTFKKGNYLIAENHLSKIDFDKANLAYRQAILKEVAFGKFNGYLFFYKYSGRSARATDQVSLYAQDNVNKKLLTSLVLKDNYIDVAELIKLEGQLFVYVKLDYTSGQSDGKLYYLDIKKMELTEVNRQKVTYKMPDGFAYKNGFELLKDGNNTFNSVIELRSEKEGKNYQALTPYSLKKNANNQFELQPLETQLLETE